MYIDFLSSDWLAFGLALSLIVSLLLSHFLRARLTLGPFLAFTAITVLTCWILSSEGWYASFWQLDIDVGPTVLASGLLISTVMVAWFDGSRASISYILVIASSLLFAVAHHELRFYAALTRPLPTIFATSPRDQMALAGAIFLVVVTALFSAIVLRRTKIAAWAIVIPIFGSQIFIFIRGIISHGITSGWHYYSSQRSEFAIAGFAGSVVLAVLFLSKKDEILPASYKRRTHDPTVDTAETIYELRSLNARLCEEIAWRSRQIVDSPAPVIGVNVDGDISLENDSARSLFVAYDTQSAYIRNFAKELFQIAEMQPFTRFSVPRRDGRASMFEFRFFSPMKTRRLFFVSDTSMLEHQLRSETIGRSVGQVYLTGRTIAHDFSNLLLAIEASAFSLTSAGAGAQAIARIQDAIQQGRRMLDDLRQHAFLGLPNVEVVRAQHLIQRTAELVGPMYASRRISVAYEADHSLYVVGDEQQLIRVLTNLCNNAAWASSDQSVIRMGAHAHDTWVRICVEDSGRGMTADQLAQAFEPGFSGRGDGRGGLGLTIAYLIVEAHAGQIRLLSTPGRGTTVDILLPMAQDCTFPDENPPLSTMLEGGGSRKSKPLALFGSIR